MPIAFFLRIFFCRYQLVKQNIQRLCTLQTDNNLLVSAGDASSVCIGVEKIPTTGPRHGRIKVQFSTTALFVANQAYHDKTILAYLSVYVPGLYSSQFLCSETGESMDRMDRATPKSHSCFCLDTKNIHMRLLDVFQ